MATYAKKTYRKLMQDYARYTEDDNLPTMQVTAKLFDISKMSRMAVYGHEDLSESAMAVVYRDGSSICLRTPRSMGDNVTHYKDDTAWEVASDYARERGLPMRNRG